MNWKEKAVNLLSDTFVEESRSSYSGYVTGKCKCCGSTWEGFDLFNGEWHMPGCKYAELVYEDTELIQP